MAIKETTRLYETLIRHHEDGSIGAHHQYLYEVFNDDDLVLGKILPPVPLSVADEAYELKLSDILGSTLIQALSQIDSLNSQVEALKSEISNAISSS